MAKDGEWFGSALYNQVMEWDKGLTKSIRERWPDPTLTPVQKDPPKTGNGVDTHPSQGAGFDSGYDWAGNKKLSKDFKPTSGNPDLLDQRPIDTTQAANTPIVMRSPDETYTSYLQQHGIKDADVKAAADKGGKIGQDWRNNPDPLAERPDYITPGTQEWAERADMQIWLDKYGHTEMAKKLKPKKVEQPVGVSVQANIGGELYDIEESAIIDIQDQNPGLSRDEAVKMIQTGTVPDVKKLPDRVGMSGEKVSDEVLNVEAERVGLQRNQAIDMPRSEEPMFLPIGKGFTNPQTNRTSANEPLMRASLRQAKFTGTQVNGPSMQPPSGLTPLTSRKSPQRNAQGNMPPRSDVDLQKNDDLISPELFVWKAQEAIGKPFFGAGYTPARPKPPF